VHNSAGELPDLPDNAEQQDSDFWADVLQRVENETRAKEAEMYCTVSKTGAKVKPAALPSCSGFSRDSRSAIMLSKDKEEEDDFATIVLNGAKAVFEDKVENDIVYTSEALDSMIVPPLYFVASSAPVSHLT
jgi:hypothetical protein